MNLWMFQKEIASSESQLPSIHVFTKDSELKTPKKLWAPFFSLSINEPLSAGKPGKQKRVREQSLERGWFKAPAKKES